MKKKKGYYRNEQGAWLNRKLIKRAEKLAEQINEQRAEKRSQILSKPFIHEEGSQAVKETVGQYHGQRATKYLGETAFPNFVSIDLIKLFLYNVFIFSAYFLVFMRCQAFTLRSNMVLDCNFSGSNLTLFNSGKAVSPRYFVALFP